MAAPVTKELSFPGAQGASLAAKLDLPKGEPCAYAIFAHCFTCSKEFLAASRISEALADLGVAVLRFDFTGLGASEGEFEGTNFTSNVGDLIAAANHLCPNRQSSEAIPSTHYLRDGISNRFPERRWAPPPLRGRNGCLPSPPISKHPICPVEALV